MSLGFREIKETISCSHCHQQMKISEKSQKHFRIVRYLFVLGICLLLAFSMNLVSTKNYIVFLATLVVAMMIASVSDRWCLILTEWIFRLEYEDYHPEKISNKDRIKAESRNKKKGLFKK